MSRKRYEQRADNGGVALILTVGKTIADVRIYRNAATAAVCAREWEGYNPAARAVQMSFDEVLAFDAARAKEYEDDPR
jgi:hypothetical protein